MAEQGADGGVVAVEIEQGGEPATEGELRPRPHIDEVAADLVAGDVEPATRRPVELREPGAEQEQGHDQEERAHEPELRLRCGSGAGLGARAHLAPSQNRNRLEQNGPSGMPVQPMTTRDDVAEARNRSFDIRMRLRSSAHSVLPSARHAVRKLASQKCRTGMAVWCSTGK